MNRRTAERIPDDRIQRDGKSAYGGQMRQMEMIRARELVYEYDKRDEEGNIIGAERAIDGVTIDVPQGSFVAVLGHNGSGKSTLAKHMNAILVPTGGTMWVDGRDTKDPANCGM